MTTKMTQPSTDIGDKISVSVGHKKNLGNYQTMDWHVSVTITHRDGETTEEAFERGWEIVYQQIDEQVAEADSKLA